MSDSNRQHQSSLASQAYRELVPQARFTLRDLIGALGYLVVEKPDGRLYVATETLGLIAAELSDLVGKDPHWGHRYLYGVLNGQENASVLLTQAIYQWGAIVDGQPVILANTESAEVRAKPGQLHPGAVVLAKSKRCAHVTCRVAFVPVVPAQRFCSRRCREEAYAAPS